MNRVNPIPSPPLQPNPVRRILNLYKSFGTQPALKNISLSLEPGETICLLGPSGCGKTTLLHTLAGLIPPDSGELQNFNGGDISCVFQEDRLLPWKTARENILFPLRDIPPSLLGASGEELTDQMLEVMELSAFAHYYPRDLSGGMKQRIALARAFCFPARFMLLDEPFKGLDPKLKTHIMELFLRLKKQTGKTALLTTHDIDEAVLLADKVCIGGGPPLEILALLPRPASDAGSWRAEILRFLAPGADAARHPAS